MTKQVILHALKVLGHIVVASLLTGLVVVLDNNPSITQGFTNYIVAFGVPVAFANVVIASALKYIQLKAAEPVVPTQP